jgi:8-oxo-dGTP pyrophosphatase MutT (NUDIX family)
VSGPAGTGPTGWFALDVLRTPGTVRRLPFRVLHQGRALEAGSVASAHLEALARWPEALHLADGVDGSVTLTLPAAERDAWFADANRVLQALGLIRAWRDEPYPVLAWREGLMLGRIERAASRFWGTLTFGAHCNGYRADANGRPHSLWIARRAFDKPTDPGLLDNLIGGGVPVDQTPGEALLREAWEEAGLRPESLRPLAAGRVLQLARDIPEGWQHEWLSVYDLALPDGLTPRNQDGEVAELVCLPTAEALALAASDAMTVDAGLVCLDFALRHRLLPPERHGMLAAALAPLLRGPAELPPVQSI